MDPSQFIDPYLTIPDLLVLKNLLRDAEREKKSLSLVKTTEDDKEAAPIHNGNNNADADASAENEQRRTVIALKELNTSSSPKFQPTIFMTWDTNSLSPTTLRILKPYISWAQQAARHPTDVVMITHLILYFTTSIPSAIYLFRHFTLLHGFAHTVMQFYYVGSYTLMRHQHIHMGGILAKRFPYSIFDAIFPYITDPLLGHTWNSYYYHHVKHHHVEGNGPDDLSSTIMYQRDDVFHLLHYIGRFYFFIWLDLPLYFFRKGKYRNALKAAFWEVSSNSTMYLIARWRFWPALFVLILPFLLLRLGLMIGNWGQHAFVDETDPDSDFRSSITLIDVPSNRFCFNDGYHTSHHLNPRRHWRDHPVAFMQQKEQYSSEGALVFRNIDYLMITFRLAIKDYAHLAKCLVPIGGQTALTMEERAEMLRTKTRRFTPDEIQHKFKTAPQARTKTAGHAGIRLNGKAD